MHKNVKGKKLKVYNTDNKQYYTAEGIEYKLNGIKVYVAETNREYIAHMGFRVFCNSVLNINNRECKVAVDKIIDNIRKDTEKIIKKILMERGSLKILEIGGTQTELGKPQYTADPTHQQLLQKTIQKYKNITKQYCIEPYENEILFGEISGVTSDDDIPGVYAAIIGPMSHYELFATSNKEELTAWAKKTLKKHIKKTGLNPQNITLDKIGAFKITGQTKKAGIDTHNIFEEVKRELY